MARKNPGTFQHRGFPRKGLERREVEKRIYGVERIAAHGFRVLSGCIIPAGFEQPITELKTKIDQFMNSQRVANTAMFEGILIGSIIYLTNPGKCLRF